MSRKAVASKSRKSVTFTESFAKTASKAPSKSLNRRQVQFQDESEDSEPVDDSASEVDQDDSVEEFEGYDSEDEMDKQASVKRSTSTHRKASSDSEGDVDLQEDDEEEEDFDGEEDGDGEFEEDDDNFPSFQSDDTLEHLESQMEQLEKEDTLALMRSSQSASKEKRKAMHVSQQLSSWRNALQLRLRLQRPLAIAEKFPEPETFPSFIKQRPQIHTSLQTAALAVADVLGDLLEIERGISNATSTLSSSGVNDLEYERPELLGGMQHEKEQPRLGMKRLHPSKDVTDEDLEYIENYLSSSWEAGEDQRTSILDKWSRRINVATGKADMQSGSSSTNNSLKVIGQSLSSQIAQTLDIESDRLMQRTKMRRLSTRSLGSPEPPKIDAWQDRTVRAEHEAKYKFDDNIFDDFDFYSVLVRELSSIDNLADETALAKSSLLNPKVAEAALAELRLRRQIEKGVDRRASKGRKLRFAPIPKLANFMVPITNAAWLAACASGPDSAEEAVTDELMLSLFGDSNVISKRIFQERQKKSNLRGKENQAIRDKQSEPQRNKRTHNGSDDEVYGDFEDVEGKDDELGSADVDEADNDDNDSHFAWFK